MKMNKKLSVLLILLMVFAFCLTGCGDSDADTDADAGKSAILVVSFGTSYTDNLPLSIGAVEDAITEAFPDYEIRRAFTSQIVIDILGEDGIEVDNMTEALDRAVADGITTLVVQPTHIMTGFEFNDVKAEVEKYADSFEKISIGEPILTDDASFETVVNAITADTASYDDGETAIAFMGHGTEAESNKVYGELQEKLTAAGFENYYVGTVEGEPTLDDVVAALEGKNYKKVVLQPLMIVAGDHANNDMAGTEEDTWYTTLTKAGYEVQCNLRGLGEIEAIRDLLVEHTQAAVDALN